MHTKNPIYDTTIRLILLLIIVVWCMLLIYPFMSVILWSIVFALTLYPLHKTISQKIGNRPKLASGILVVAILLIVIVPLAFISLSMIEEVKEIKTSYENGTLVIPAPSERISSIPVVGQKIYDTWKNASQDLESFIQTHQEELLVYAQKVAKGVLSAMSGLAQIILSLVIAGVLLVVGGIGETVRNVFRKVAGEHGDTFATMTVQTVNSVVKGILGESLIMAVLLGLVIMLGGVPYAGIWTLMVFVFAVVQIPTLVVTIPVIIYFYTTKEPVPATIWSVVLILVSMLDSILTPIMLGKGAPVPTLVIFIGTIGGFILSGFIGLFTGAIVMSIGYTLFKQWVKPEEIPQEPHV